MREREPFVYGYCMRDAVPGVEDDTGGATRSVEREHGLDGDIECRYVESLEHDLGHLFAIRLWVEGGFGEKDGMLFWRDA